MGCEISAARLSELVGLVYDCAVNPLCWPIAMDAIRTELNFHNSTLNVHKLPSGELVTILTSNIPARYAALMAGSGPDVLGQWGGENLMQTLPLDRPAVLRQVNPDFDVDTTTNRHYLAFSKPQGIIDALAIVLARDSRVIGTLAFDRHRSAGPIGGREIAVAGLLMPHLQRAASINRTLDGAAEAKATLETTLDTLSVPILLVGAELDIVHANAAAKQLLDDGELVQSANGLLTTRTPASSCALTRAVARAARYEGPAHRGGSQIALSAEDGPSGALYLMPLRQTGLAMARAAVAAVFVAKVGVPSSAPTATVAALFDLTPAEARVFEYLVTGHTLAKAAKALGVGRSTVKTHLLRLYDKVGVRRQADLVQVAASLAIPVVA